MLSTEVVKCIFKDTNAAVAQLLRGLARGDATVIADVFTTLEKAARVVLADDVVNTRSVRDDLARRTSLVVSCLGRHNLSHVAMLPITLFAVVNPLEGAVGALYTDCLENAGGAARQPCAC